jgi:hypothetical protein
MSHRNFLLEAPFGIALPDRVPLVARASIDRIET